MNAQFIVLTNAAEGQDTAFNAWYDEIHLGEVCAVPGVVAAARSRAPDVSARYRYCAIYQIEADDPAKVVAEIFRRYESGEMATTDAMAEDMLTTLYELAGVNQ